MEIGGAMLDALNGGERSNVFFGKLIEHYM